MKTRTGFVKDEDHANIVLLVEELGSMTVFAAVPIPSLIDS
jgi:uncharacterized surface protein with fasciclin (FAS1) repeats